MTTAKLKISKHVTIDVPASANLATLMKPAAISQNGKSIMVTDAMQNYVIAAFDRHADNAWVYLGILPMPNNASSAAWGESLSISADGRLAAVSIPDLKSNGITVGAFQLYHWING